jgi:penicillin-binding protein 1A
LINHGIIIIQPVYSLIFVGFFVHILNKLFKLSLLLILLGALTVAAAYLYLRDELPSVETLKDVQLQTPMKVYTADGLLISQYGEKRRIPLQLSEIPQPLIDAVLATEDSRFYQHPGFDLIGIIRAVSTMVFSNKRSQGASTITQQLARNFFLTRERTLTRKVKELFIALHIESVLSKDEILALYLNKIELGHRAFGVGAAARVYYGKAISQLTLAEMATIAGLPKAPSTMNPISRPKRAIARRAVVLGRMLAMKHITKAEYNQAKAQPVTAKKHGAQIEAPAPYVAALINAKMIKRYGIEDAYTKGFKVYTTVPAKLQFAAQQAVMNNLHNYDERHGYRGPEKYLWTPLSEEEKTQAVENNTPLANIDRTWTTNKIDEHLNKLSAYGQIAPGVVTEMTEQSAFVQLQNGSTVMLDWNNLKWARAFINDNKSGKKPKTTADFLTIGAQIWVRKTDSGLYRLAQIPEPSGALIAINPTNGAIRSVVGGYSYYLSQYNRATQAKRQVGSNIKPFIYSAALEHGHTLASLINDAPIHQWDKELGVAWRPKNSPAIYEGPTRLRVALAKSKNVISVRLLKGVGLENAVNHIEKFGIPRSELPLNDSLALGSASLTPQQVASGISTFANGGYLIEPYLIDQIKDANNKVIYQANPMTACRACENEIKDNDSKSSTNSNKSTTAQIQLTQVIPAPRVISSQNAFLISQAMTSTIWGGGDWNHKTGWNGTGWRAQKLKRRDVSGKTGTTNDARDTWFSGFNNHLMVTTWVGFDNPSRALGRSRAGSEAGARTAQPAWVEYMKTALKDVEEGILEIPQDIISVRIDEETGLLATKNDHTSRFEYFIRGTEPDKYATDDTIAEVIDNDGEGKVNDEEEIF